MCRNIRTLYNFEPPATEDEVRASALQYVRKVSGFTKPSRANEEAFAQAVDEVAEATSRLIASLVTTAAPKDHEVEAERARARSAKRFAAAWLLRTPFLGPADQHQELEHRQIHGRPSPPGAVPLPLAPPGERLRGRGHAIPDVPGLRDGLVPIG